MMGGDERRGRGGGGDRGDREGGYRRRDRDGKDGGAPGDFTPSFNRGGLGRGRGGPLPP